MVNVPFVDSVSRGKNSPRDGAHFWAHVDLTSMIILKDRFDPVGRLQL